MISMDEFKKYLVENIKSFLPNEFKDAEVFTHETQKNNNIVLDSLIIKLPGEDLAPNIYINDFYKGIMQGKSLNVVAKEMAAFRLSVRTNMSVRQITDFKDAKENIVFKLVNKERNHSLLKDIPYKIQNDMLITYRWVTEINPEGVASVLVRNNLLDHIGVDKNDLYEIAKKNTLRLFPPKICSMQDMFLGLGKDAVPIEEFNLADFHYGVPMYIITNDSGINGAGTILYPEVLENLSDKFGGNLYLLPSSIHEMVVIPEGCGISVKELKSMVTSVNQDPGLVNPTEFLSNEVYLFDKDKQRIKVATESKDVNKEFIEMFLRNNENQEHGFNNDEMDLEQ